MVFIGDVRHPAAGEAASDIAASFLRPNSLLDTGATERLRQDARDAQEAVTVSYRSGQPIVGEGEPLSMIIIDAIDQTGAATGRPVREAGVLVVLGAVMAVLALYISRYRADLWDRIHLSLSLLGLLTVLAAGAVRFVTFVGEVFGYEVGVYVLPAVAFGYFAAVLLDNRTGLLMAVIVAVVAAVGTRDPGATIYALLATLAPVGFVSAASSRRAFRNSVAISAAALSVIAAATAWIFHTSLTQSPVGTMLQAAVLAFASSLIAALVALAAMAFFESVFDVTTTLRLLDLTDRNHAALQLLQEKAFGTFNHSLMVGTLAGAAATAIGANNLLARAAAYYHDLGKTENPSFFIENQFGANPHDQMGPEESAEVIRRHVTDGMKLAARHRIPSSVAAGIITHHGNGVMRFFYDKAIGLYGEENVNVDDYRHVGEKPRSKEMAILMLADGVEGACRAAFQSTSGQGAPSEPTLQAIAAVTDGIIREKMSDLQLNESSLTFADLQSIRNAFIDAMSGHYHQRIQYPNFP